MNLTNRLLKRVLAFFSFLKGRSITLWTRGVLSNSTLVAVGPTGSPTSCVSKGWNGAGSAAETTPRVLAGWLLVRIFRRGWLTSRVLLCLTCVRFGGVTRLTFGFSSMTNRALMASAFRCGWVLNQKKNPSTPAPRCNRTEISNALLDFDFILFNFPLRSRCNR